MSASPRFLNFIADFVNVGEYFWSMTPRGIGESNFLGLRSTSDAILRKYRPDVIQRRLNPSYRLERYQEQAKEHQALNGSEFSETTWYKYSPLPSSRHIRLLQLDPGNQGDVITTSLSAHSVDALPEFSALSYTWGDAQITHTIACEGASLVVTRNLWQALHRLRLPDQPRTLWIDALCINQADEQERNGQVKLMGEIYSKAAQVIVWLGEADARSKQGFELIEKLYPVASRYPSYRVISDPYIRSVDFTHEDLVGLPPTGMPDWRALESVYWRPWWTRVWCLQEICLARSATMMCGDMEIDASHPILVADFLQHSGIAQMTEIGLGSAVGVGAWRWACLIDQKMDLRHLLSATRLYHSTDRRDKIYGLLGVCKEEDAGVITPDYSRSVEDIYIALTMSYIREGSLDILSAVCDLTWRLSPGLPSWIPDWSAVHRATEFLMPGRALNAAATGTSPIQVRFSSCGKKLYAAGSHFDIIDRVSAPYLFRSAKEHRVFDLVRDYAGEGFENASARMGTQLHKSLRLRQWQRLALGLKQYPTGEPIQTVYMKTVTADTFVETETMPLETAYNAFLETELVKKRKKEHSNEALEAHHFFDVAMERASSGRVLFITNKGYMGLGPQSLRKKDRVVLLSGGKTPYTVRERQDEGWVFLGESYIHGIMQGEAFKENNPQEELCLV